MKLTQLIQLLEPVEIKNRGNPSADVDIRSVHYRSQDVGPRSVFVAIPGFNADGHDFVEEAVGRGAVAVVVQKDTPTECTTLKVPNTRKALAVIADHLYEHPSSKLVVIGITGTNGKTTTSYLLESILQSAGHSVGVIGTVNYRYEDRSFDNPMTTPESPDLQKILHNMHQAGVTHVVLEVSSHSIDLYRIQNCYLDVAIFTNLSQDHLDFHGSMEGYWASKKRLFTDFLPAGPKGKRALAVINANDNRGRELLGSQKTPLTTGFSDNCSIRIHQLECHAAGISGQIVTPSGAFDFQSALSGHYNVENILSATGAAVALGIPLFQIAKGILQIGTIPGRLERISDPAGRLVYVDYAHTPNALENVLKALRLITRGRLVCVFGCGGDRDTDKRSKMGFVAARESDLAVVTSDNPRSEPPLDIIDHILPGIKRKMAREYRLVELPSGYTEKGFVIEPDRRQAIHLAIKAAQPGDCVLIAGKGHENYQILGKQTVPFDDREEARQALSDAALVA